MAERFVYRVIAYGEWTRRRMRRGFMGEQNVCEPEQMSLDRARAVLRTIAESKDPRIQLYPSS